ncbi:electron transfer flavoprotein subunit alpha/FixB family protein [Nitriliruptor alkaliphilus]|uniref:electron transfer flavoprotein subunit alpha/FixB family protein n=1 Tax=Nitriliruptor alkaliphilus TaxID=427918 RepID=UPI00069672ED|nr:electron transfer flavoprotein subunit alpha/FixB family protein [Nitriliruptor alkaliphilus]
MSGTILALVELETDGSVAATSERILTFARRLDGVLTAAVIGPVGELAVDGLRRQGVEVVHALEHPLLVAYAPAAWAEAVAQLLDTEAAAVVVAAATDRGNEVMAHLAARTDQPLATNCLEVTAVDDGWALTRQRWGGVLLEDAHLDAEVALLTCVPHAVAAEPAGTAGAAEVRIVTAELTAADVVGQVREQVRRTEGISLATAPVVVSGGRGVGSAEGFGALEELAELLGGAVGCSRVATNNGWRSHNDQVGQTGTRVTPQLYIALGISGATQHWVGCMNAKTILAVNTDADAPMVTRAHYAVVGDLHALLPALLEEVRKRKTVRV